MRFMVPRRILPDRVFGILREKTANQIRRLGKEGAQEAGVHGLHDKLIDLMGRLSFRTSYSQNVLRHSIEVSFLTGMLAEQLGRSSAALGGILVDPGDGPVGEAGRREQAAMLAEALQRLSAEDRDVLVLRHLEGLSFPEVAERMCQSLDSVKKRWPRALLRLRQAYRGDEP